MLKYFLIIWILKCVCQNLQINTSYYDNKNFKTVIISNVQNFQVTMLGVVLLRNGFTKFYQILYS